VTSDSLMKGRAHTNTQNVVVNFSPQHGAFSNFGQSRWPPEMKGNFER